MQSTSARTIRAGHLITVLVVFLLPLHAWADIFATFGPAAGFCMGGSSTRGFEGASNVVVVELEVQPNVLKPLTLVKPIDGCTTALLGAAIAGTEIDPVVIAVTESGGHRVLYEISLQDAEVARVAQEGQDGQLVEGVTIQSDAATIRLFRYDTRGRLIGIDEVSLVGE